MSGCMRCHAMHVPLQASRSLALRSQAQCLLTSYHTLGMPGDTVPVKAPPASASEPPSGLCVVSGVEAPRAVRQA